MNNNEYELFKKMWYEKFRGYYKKGRISRVKLKESIYNNPKLQQTQKDDFWRLISKGDHDE